MAKMHKIRFPLGELTAHSPRPLRGLLLKGRRGKEEWGREGKGGHERGQPPTILA